MSSPAPPAAQPVRPAGSAEPARSGWRLPLVGSLRARLVAVMLVSILPVVWLTVQGFVQQRDHATTMLEGDALGFARSLVQAQAARDGSARQLLATLAHATEIGAARAADCDALLEGLLKADTRYVQIGYADAQGEIVCKAAPGGGVATRSVAERDWFRSAIDNRDFAIGALQPGPLSPAIVETYALPLAGAGGRVRGVVFAGTDFSWIESMHRLARLPAGVVVMLIDRDDRIVVRVPEAVAGPQVDGPAVARLRAAAAPGAEPLHNLDADGIERLYVAQPLRAGSGGPLVAVGLPWQAALGPAQAELLRDLLWLALFAALALSLAWFGARRMILLPVSRMVEVSRRIEEGDLGARSTIATGATEIRQLSRALDSMASSLEARESERDLAAARLLQSEAHLLLAQRVGRVGSWYVDFSRRRPRPVEWSEETYRMLGFEPHSFRPTENDFYDLVHPADRRRVVRSIMDSARHGQPVALDHRAVLPDGSERHFSLRSDLIRGADGSYIGIVGTLQDITERVQAQRALATSELKFRAVFEGSHDAIFVLRGDEIVDCNGRAVTLFGHARAELLAMGWSALSAADRGASGETGASPSAAGLVAGEQPQTAERMFRRRDGTDFQAEVTFGALLLGDERLVQAVVRDVTGAKRARQALLESEQRERNRAAELAAVLNAVPAAVWIAHDPAGRRVSGNRASYQLLDADIAATGDPHASSELFPADAQLFRDHVEIAPYELPIQVAAGLGIEVRDFEQQLVFKDGRMRTVFGNATPLLGRDGAPRGAVAAFLDITDLKRTAEALRREKERVEVTLAAIGDAVITTDAHGVVDYMNPVAELLAGQPAGAGVGRPLSELFTVVDEATRSHTRDLVAECIEQQALVELREQSVLLRADGGELFIDASAAPLRERGEVVTGAVLVLHDVTQQRKIAQQISYQATHDALTGLINRFEFERRLARVLGGAREEATEHALAYLDLDQFKVVNDTCGHAAGDELLRQIAMRLQERMRKRDTLARLGGDEFGVLLEHCPADQARRVANSLVQTVRDFRFTWEGKTFTIGVSIGLVMIDTAAGSLANLLSSADAACYAAKERGRNRVHVYHPDDQELARRHGEMQWVARLTSAIEENRLRLDAQPIVPLNPAYASHPPHYEMLVRVLDDHGKVTPPGAFIPAAERYNLMPTIDRWVIRRSIEWLRGEIAEHADAPPVCSINLSGTSLADDHLFGFIRDELHACGVPARALCFEITETAAISNLNQAIAFIDEMRTLGCSFALDDFGAGMSSFAYLKNLKVDYLKIDGSFVKDLVDDPIDCAMVEAINRIGQVMGIRTIAEYAENERIIGRLREIGVDFAQGYGVRAPQPIELPPRQERRLRIVGG
jgi:diguanylate cyclase (GGDEF)-like protein/PAS domain S-box-containing protein